MKIALDAMGGDFAPQETVLGAIEASREFGAEVILVGIEKEIRTVLDRQQTAGLKLEIYHASEVIAMDEHPANAVKRKKDSSLVVANRLVKEGKADAVISMGNTGAAMTASLFTLGRLGGIKRPAIASVMPTKAGLSIILDAGANADCEPENLLEFAYMGSAYVEHIFGIPNPKVGLLSIGEEETKGNKLTVEAHQLLRNSNLNFIGNIEGRDVHRGVCDVIVCDGFVGNVVLKLSEGLASVLMAWMKEAISTNTFSMMGGLMLKAPLKKMLGPMDPAEYGGMPLLGLNGISMIGHGSSKAKAVKNAIRAATNAVNQDIVGAISRTIEKASANRTDHSG